jgi:HEAT repeat protein
MNVKWAPILSILVVCLPPAAAEPSAPLAARGVIVTNDRWPDATDTESFARSIFRIERTRNESEEADALFRWMQKCTLSGPPAYEGMSSSRYTHDAGKIIFVHGYSTCDGLGATLAQIWRSLGRMAHRTYIPARGHTIAELEYRDADAVKRWHIFDTHGHWYGRTPDGHAASSIDLAKKPDLVPLRGTWSGYRMTAAVHSWTPSASRWSGRLSLHPQESVDLLWEAGGRCYVRPETIKSENRKVFFKEGSLFRRTVGAAHFVYRPDFAKQKLEEACLASDASAKNGTVSNSAAGAASLEFSFPSPYMYTAASFSARATCGADGDSVTLHLRRGGRGRWRKIAEHSRKGEGPLKADLAGKDGGNVAGWYAFDLKIELRSKQPGGAALTELAVERRAQLNRRVLPHVCIGYNTFTIKAQELAGGWMPKVRIEWLGRGGEEFEGRTPSECPHSFAVFGARRRHEEPPIVMRRIRIECVPAPAKTLVERGAKGVDESDTAERILALARSGRADALEALRRELASDDMEARYWAAHGLGELGHAAAVADLSRTLKTDPATKVRLSAANALGMLKAREGVPALIEALDKKAYANLGEGKENQISFGWMYPVRWQAARSLAEIGDRRAVGPLISQLEKTRGSDTDYVVFLARALAALEAREAVPVLRRKSRSRAAGSAGGRACLEALTKLARPDDPDVRETIAIFVKALNDRWPDIRAQALAGLAKLRAKDAVPDIRRVLEKERETITINAARRALEQIEN